MDVFTLIRISAYVVYGYKHRLTPSTCRAVPGPLHRACTGALIIIGLCQLSCEARVPLVRRARLAARMEPGDEHGMAGKGGKMRTGAWQEGVVDGTGSGMLRLPR